MANDYLEFSEVLDDLQPPEEAWLREQLALVYVYNDREFAENDVPEELAARCPDWYGLRFLRDMEHDLPTAGHYAGFEYEFCDDDALVGHGRHLWLHARQWAEPDRVAQLVRKFLQKFRPGRHWSLTYASYCSQPHVGQFEGGALFVTAAEVLWESAYGFVDKQVATFEQGQNARRLARLAEELGLCAQQLDEAVHETAASEAASVNNAGIECQLEFLVAARGAAETERILRAAAVDDRTRKAARSALPAGRRTLPR